MSKSHGKLTVITVATNDISPYCTNSQLTRGGDKHDLTGYGKDDHVFQGGLKSGSFTCEGWYDNTATVGPGIVMKPLVLTVVAVTRKVEGTGVGKPLESFSALLEEYVETSPVADYVKWSAKFTVSDAITDSTQ